MPVSYTHLSGDDSCYLAWRIPSKKGETAVEYLSLIHIWNFGRQNANAKLVCLTDGEVLSVEDGDLSMLLGGVSEIVYDNTASIGQLKGRTEEGLADELRNEMANYQGSSDGELDVAAALEDVYKRQLLYDVSEK